MKTIFRLSGQIVAILLVALVVVGITLSVVDTSATAQLPADRTSVIAEQQLATQTSEGAMPEREFHGPTDQSVAARLAFSLFGIVQNVVIIGVIVLLVNWVERRFILRPAKVVS